MFLIKLQLILLVNGLFSYVLSAAADEGKWMVNQSTPFPILNNKFKVDGNAIELNQRAIEESINQSKSAAGDGRWNGIKSFVVNNRDHFFTLILSRCRCNLR